MDMFDYSTLIVAGIGAFSLAVAFLEYTFSKKRIHAHTQ
jgi:hypothetical protein